MNETQQNNSATQPLFSIKDVTITVAEKTIIENLQLQMQRGEFVVIMGPNGSGKSSLANGLMGHPEYTITGSAILNEVDLIPLKSDARSRTGLFLSFQHPPEIAGVNIASFLRMAVNAHREPDQQLKVLQFNTLLKEKMTALQIPESFAKRSLHEGFSGGEKKKLEILQLALLEPKLAILDEPDSGLDVDALKTVCSSIELLKKQQPDMIIILVTHYQRMLHYIHPDRVIIFKDGKIVKEGTSELAKTIEERGYDGF